MAAVKSIRATKTRRSMLETAVSITGRKKLLIDYERALIESIIVKQLNEAKCQILAEI